MLGDIPASTDERVLIDFRTSDDAGVYRWAGGPLLVQTVDFFTPIVDDPHVFGQIAAANALSDIFAMGARPLTALAIAAFPADLDRHVVRAICSVASRSSGRPASPCSFGFISYALLKIATGRGRSVHWMVYLFAALLLARYAWLR